jgi:hypothetical protein
VPACFPFSLAATKLAWPAPFLFLRTAQLPAHLSPAATPSMPPRIGLSSSSSPDRAMPVMSIRTSATEPDPVAAYARDVWALDSFVSHQTSQHEVGYRLRSEEKKKSSNRSIHNELGVYLQIPFGTNCRMLLRPCPDCPPLQKDHPAPLFTFLHRRPKPSYSSSPCCLVAPRSTSSHRRAPPHPDTPLGYFMTSADHQRELTTSSRPSTTRPPPLKCFQSPLPLRDRSGELVVLLRPCRKKSHRECHPIAPGRSLWRASPMVPP